MAYGHGQKRIQVAKNPRNPVNPLYKALTKLFSGSISDTSRQNPRHLKRWQLDKFQFTSATGREFKKSQTNPFEFMQLKAMQQQNRQDRMVDFDSMEYQPEIASALDMYADEMTTFTEIRPVLNIKSPNPEVRKVLKTLFYDILNIEHNAFGLCRSMCKYGDFFWYLDVDEKLGIQNAIGIPSAEIERLEGEDPKNPRYVQFQWNTAGLTLEDWQVAHFRILGNDKFVPYGTAILDSIRRVWRCLNMVEDAMMAYRIVRAADRRIFYIDVGALPNKEVEGYIEKVRTEMKRNQIVDASSGRVDLRYNPQPVSARTPIPLLDGRTITIRQLAEEFEQGKQNWVYSVQDETKQVVPGKVVWCGKNYTAQKQIKVWLDNESYVMTAPEHPFVLRSGEKIRADQLVVGDRLMPFERKRSSKESGHRINDYDMVYNPRKFEYGFTHRIVANRANSEQLLEARKNTDWVKNNNLTVHHKDFNRLNNNPENLLWIGNIDHIELHSQNTELLRQRMIEYNKTEKNRENTIRYNKIYDKGRRMGEKYNGTALHKEHNKIRRAAQQKSWGNPEEKQKRSESMRLVVPNEVIPIFQDIYVKNPDYNREKFISAIRQNAEVQKILKESNPETKRNVKKISALVIDRVLREWGFTGLKDFKNKALEGFEYKNHQVSRIEEVFEAEDVFCMTVEGPNGENDRHNFGCLGLSLEGLPVSSGIYLGNSIEEDYFIAVRGDKGGTRIDTLQGSEYNGVIEDVKYLRDKLFSGLKIPQSYLTYGEGGGEERSTLAQKDVHFARTIMRIQRAVVSEFTKIARIHLYVLGFKKKDLLNFTLSLNPPSKIAELQEIEHWKAKFDVAAAATESIFSTRWIAKNIHGLTDEEYLRNLREKAFDKRFEAMLEVITQKEMPQMPDDPMGDPAGGGLDDIMPGGSSLDSGGGSPGGEKPEEPTLLAQPDAGSIKEVQPGKRSDIATTTDKSKGKLYNPSIYDKRKSGARKRSWLKSSGLSHAEGGPRNILPGAAELGNFMNDIFERIDEEYENSIDEANEKENEENENSIYLGIENKMTLLKEVSSDASEVEQIFKDIPKNDMFGEKIKQQTQEVKEKLLQYNRLKNRGFKNGDKK